MSVSIHLAWILTKPKLVNFRSGGPVDDAVAGILLDVFDNGNIQAERF